jgi:hypothetical protein
MGHVSWQESLAFVEAAHDMGYSHRLVITHVQAHMVAMPLEAMKRAAAMGAFLESCSNALAPGRLDAAELVNQMRAAGLRQVIASTDYFRPYSPNPAELFRMYLGMLHEGGLSTGEIHQVASINPGRALGLD